MSKDEDASRRFAEQTLEEAERLLRFDEGDPPVEPVDELSRRRDINAALDLAQAAGEPLVGNRAPASTRRLTALGAVAAAAVAAGVVLGLAIGLDDGPDSVAPGTGAVPSWEPAALPIRVLLASGDRGGLAEALLDGEAIRAGRRLETAGGPAVLGVSSRAKIRVAASTRLVLERADSEECRLRLESGEVLASVTPGSRDPRVVVATADGVVSVTGTVFAVRADADGSTVEVFRGNVLVEGSGRKAAAVRAGHRARLAAPGTESIEQDHEAEMLAVARALDLLDASEMALIEVHSSPAGASVSLDGKVLGETPIVLATRAGYRELELAHEGYAPIREQLVAGRDGVVSRHFDLVRDPDQEPQEQSDRQSRPDPTLAHRGPDEPADALSAVDLLAHAQTFRKSRNWAAAAQAYGELLSSFPGSPEARNARVSLGMIQLKHLGRPAEALVNFDAYLGQWSSGVLAQEALIGRARALRALGRTGQEADALREFVERFPGALQVDEARQRLAEIER